MPTKIVDLSARSEIIRDEPFHVHFWECTPQEFLAYLGTPRKFLSAMGIKIPADCRIETTIENNDGWGSGAQFQDRQWPRDYLQRRRGKHRQGSLSGGELCARPTTVGKFKRTCSTRRTSRKET